MKEGERGGIKGVKEGDKQRRREVGKERREGKGSRGRGRESKEGREEREGEGTGVWE